MAEPITLQQLTDASLNTESLDDLVNGDDSVQVITRTGETYPSIQKLIKVMFENGGLPATPFATRADKLAAALPVGSYAVVTNDSNTDYNKLWYRDSSGWIVSKYDAYTNIKTYVDANPLFKPLSLTSATNLNDVVTDGVYITPLSASTLVNNYPFDKKNSTVYVVRQGIVVRQHYFSDAGIAQRYGVLTDGVWVWKAWQGINYKLGEIINIDDYALTTQAVSYSTVSDISELNGHLDAATTTGSYQVLLRSLATVENGFPITGQAGILTVRMPLTTGIVHQVWQSYNGYAMRWGSVPTLGDSPIWQPWQGFKNESGSIVDIATSTGGGDNKKVIYGWGSSTLELAGSYFTTMAERHNHVYVGHGVSGETLAVSGMQQGSNIVTLKFADATLTNNTNHAVTITQSFKPKRGRAYKEVELSNGVKGLLYFSEYSTNANTFKPTNLTEPLAVDTTYEYRAINPDFINQGKGLYYFNIGKNNMGYADTAQDIVDAQQQMIDYIPEGSKYLVGGHFVNAGTSGSGYANKVVAVNQILKLRYGLRFCDYYDFLYDDAIWTKYGITKTAEDIAAIAAGELPPSLGRDIGTGTRDVAHLRDEMSAEIALQAEARFIKLGYFS